MKTFYPERWLNYIKDYQLFNIENNVNKHTQYIYMMQEIKDVKYEVWYAML